LKEKLKEPLPAIANMLGNFLQHQRNNLDPKPTPTPTFGVLGIGDELKMANYPGQK